MTTAAIITMVLTMVIVSSFVAYFFTKMLRTPPKSEPDSFSENDELPR
jgi:hypothetical protein